MPERALLGQIVRYAISGAALTGFYAVVYWLGAVAAAIAPLIANTIAFVLTSAIGYVVHSRWSFKGHGSRDNAAKGYVRFVAVNLGGFALNSFWVWLIVERLHQNVSLPLVPICFVTPWLMFWVNRRWTFQ